MAGLELTVNGRSVQVAAPNTTPLLDVLRNQIAAGQRDGAFAPVASAETVTLMVFGIVNQLPQWYQQEGPKTPHQLGNEIADFVLAALTPP